MRRGSDGFTLLEVLVALVVMGLLIGALAQGTRFGLASLDRTARRVEAQSALEATERSLRGLIAQMLPATPAGPPALQGTRGTLAFRSVTARATNRAVSRVVPVAFGLAGDGRLVLRDPDETVLLGGVLSVAFSYWDGAWHDSWSARDPPLLIRVRLTFAPGDERHWPDIVIAPMRERPAG